MAKRKRKGGAAVLAPPSEPPVMRLVVRCRRVVPGAVCNDRRAGPSVSDVVRTPKRSLRCAVPARQRPKC